MEVISTGNANGNFCFMTVKKETLQSSGLECRTASQVQRGLAVGLSAQLLAEV